jgi:hypothetical protein
MNYRKTALAILLVVVAGVAVWLGSAVWNQRQWRALQAGQMATILRLGEVPPPGWNQGAWRNALVTPHNVWGNVIYHPSSSGVKIDEMRGLQLRLNQIVDDATTQNSFESVDRVFALLLEQGRQTEFISGFREEFQSHRDAMSQPAWDTLPADELEQAVEGRCINR